MRTALGSISRSRLDCVVFSVLTAVIPAALLMAALIVELMARDVALYEPDHLWQYRTKAVGALLLGLAGYTADVMMLWIWLPRMWPRGATSFTRRVCTSLIAAALFTGSWFIAFLAFFLTIISRLR